MLHGLLLAAGEASRMPNKPLLPQANGQLVIESGLHFLNHNCDDITVVENGTRIISKALTISGWSLQYKVQDDATGVMDAIRCGVQGMTGEVVIAFCDNIYDFEERVPDRYCASIRKVEGELDGYTDKWVYRDENPTWKLAGWYRVPVGFVDDTKDVLDWLNKWRIEAHAMFGKWYDVGTVKSYGRYLDEHLNK